MLLWKGRNLVPGPVVSVCGMPAAPVLWLWPLGTSSRFGVSWLRGAQLGSGVSTLSPWRKDCESVNTESFAPKWFLGF